MIAAPFDTLKMARKLESSVFPAGQAAGVAEAMAEAKSVADLATKADISRLDLGMARLESEIARIERDLRAEIKSESRSLRHDIELLGRDLTIRLVGMMVAGFGLVLGAMRYMLAHP